MNLHLMPNEKFAKKFIDFVDVYFNDLSNHIYVYGISSNFTRVKSPNVEYIQSFDEVDFSLFNSDDKFFVHGFYNNRLLRFLYKVRSKFKKNQLVLIAWGGDIYNNRFYLNDHKMDVWVLFHEFLKRKIIGKTNIFMTFACADFEVIKEYYHGKGVQFDCLYPSNADITLLNELKRKEKNSNSVRVLLGNSATSTNNHKEALDYLKAFKEEDMEIICPLSYGDNNYAKEVDEYGKSLFGEKYRSVFDYLSPEEYSKLLNSVDIAVFNHNRQQATGNIEILSYLGKKIYISSDTTTWKHYVDRDKCIFFDSKRINEMTFSEFVEFSDTDREVNEKYFERIWDLDYIKELWLNVINYK